MFNKLFAVCLLVRDLDVSIQFYQDILGLELSSQDDGFADFKMDGTLLALFQQDKAVSMLPTAYMGPGGGAVLAFQVDDVENSCAELKARGVNIVEGPKTTSWGQTVAYFLDPDDNIWEISKR